MSNGKCVAMENKSHLAYCGGMHNRLQGEGVDSEVKQ